MKKEILTNLIKIKKLGDGLGLPIKEVGVIDYYLEDATEILPEKIIGIKITGGIGEKVELKQK